MISTCNQLSNNSLISVKEPKRKVQFIIDNKSKLAINKVTVDGCLIDSNTSLKCDYLFEILDGSTIIKVLYIELKGKDLTHAILQLEATIKYCLQYHNSHNRECHVVSTAVPKASTKSTTLKKEFRRKNHIQLFIDTMQKTVII
ncbi:MAG: hypothetical protein A2540_03665 [Sulfurimonas sp. RIFOXYD2_FULL_37_8]|nr:MAG: hypothetical protein A2540_03665 [Sulfurimonas sp. RIFOXYD2_FULL_37_8]